MRELRRYTVSEPRREGEFYEYQDSPKRAAEVYAQWHSWNALAPLTVKDVTTGEEWQFQLSYGTERISFPGDEEFSWDQTTYTAEEFHYGPGGGQIRGPKREPYRPRFRPEISLVTTPADPIGERGRDELEENS